MFFDIRESVNCFQGFEMDHWLVYCGNEKVLSFFCHELQQSLYRMCKFFFKIIFVFPNLLIFMFDTRLLDSFLRH